ncbi:uncharacterized protein LOC126373461 [Pectinophora gossypiella]|uniref:uncharacterized protein LOC126373461 n=1 Tax=Pectinophora gossypiella TaxID=13191 RepID=UPI00214F594F|nr:uncharacterized protein LOC126373461 [Pectinophora gossypiella]
MTANDMHAKYPNKQPTRVWDPLRIEYPVRKFPGAGETSVTIGHEWRAVPEVSKSLKIPLDEIKRYYRDYTVSMDLMRSQSTKDFGVKHPETKKFNKHTSSTENLYIYPPNKRITDQPPLQGVYGSTEMRSAYKVPTTPARLVTDKDQFKHPASLPLDPPFIEPSFHKEIEPLDTTHEGFQIYLDPYLTTNRLHHRPYTAEQLSRPSNTRDIVTYYTLSDTPMVRTPKTKHEEWRLPLSRPKSMYDREKFKQDFREIRTHNRHKWVPGAFRTEVKDNYTPITTRPDSRIHNSEAEVRSMYQRALADLPTNIDVEYSAYLQDYRTENSTVGSGKPLCTIIDQYPEMNKRLEIRERNIRSKFQKA